jgi:flagellar P-ring protein FlgI
MRLQIVRRIVLVISTLGLIAWAAPAEARTLLKTICRVKGQEENVIQGLGYVVGLKGTGDSNSLPTIRGMAQIGQNFGSPMGKAGEAELKDMKNVARVIVTATIPAAGARQGDKLDCTVSSVGSAKSLAGGRLFTTALGSQNPKDLRVYAVAEGLITLDSATQTTTGRIHTGCRLEEDFLNVFALDGKITLVLDRNYADFQVASEVAVLINSSTVGFQSNSGGMARAINQNNIEVTIPRQYADAPVEFISQVLGLQIPEPQTGARVVINERAGSIVMSGDAEIGPVVVTHKNIVVETGSTTAGARFVPIDPKNDAPTLKSLVEALNAVHVPTEDIIEVIKGLERNGKLRAQLIIE